MSMLTKAITIAARCHEGQTDKGGQPYIFHPFRLMLRALTEDEQIVAALHDTVEDSDLTLDDLRREGFSDEIVEAVDRLSRRESETYEAFILRIKGHRLAARVKILDLQDNMDLTRIKESSEEDRQRVEKYSRALDVLLS
ncbi:GTP pyrophosphokinase [Saccharibacillus sp. CPCC 101409]|uniref:HD domain-containing protein n=1 Tax=Saccharibacillus sp. CPCC 101409 TaxID=3058041 RepID=UPI0026722BEF|nr:HD domain-containing protein [Saccharibacillus sp. CPCC 101409]MDO3408258.1 GTP pyrophosphokinase [Saccharibacillus sp. CPCC 101409]